MAEDRVQLPREAVSTWILGSGAEHDGRVAKHRLAAEVRRLIEATTRIDVADGVAAPIDAVADEVAELVDRIATRPRFPAGAAEAGIDDSRLLERSGISGACNPLATPMHIWLDGDRVRGWAEFGFAYEGPPGCVHGGFVAAAFDDLLGIAQTLSGTAGFTGTLHVRMVRPTPLHRRIDYEARVESLTGRKIVAVATATCDGEVVAEAEGLFITPRAGDQDERILRSASPFTRDAAGAAD